MIETSDRETIRRIYRLRRLLATHEDAIESTFKLCGATFGASQEEVTAIALEEDQRRAKLIAQSWAAAQDLAK